MTAKAAEQLYSVAEVAALWRCSREHVYELIRKRRLRANDIAIKGSQLRISASAINEFLSRKERAA